MTSTVPHPRFDHPDFYMIPLDGLRQYGIKLIYHDRIFEPSASEADLIEGIWKKLLSEDKNRILYDGPMVRLISFSMESGIPVIEMERTSYRVFCGTNRRIPRAADGDCADGVGICGVVVTGDNKIVIGRRSEKVYEYPHYYHVIGGNMDPDNHRNSYNIPDPFVAFQREVEEETGAMVPLEDIGLIGLARNKSTHKPEFLFMVKVETASEKIEMDEEHGGLKFIEDNRRSLWKFLKNAGKKIVPAGRAALIAYGYKRFGAEWIAEGFNGKH